MCGGTKYHLYFLWNMYTHHVWDAHKSYICLLLYAETPAALAQ